MKRRVLYCYYIAVMAVSSFLFSACEVGGLGDPAATSTVVPDTSRSLTSELMEEQWLQLEFPFARFYFYEPQRDKLKQVADALENRYAYFQQKYGFDSLDQVTVYLYPDFESMKPDLKWKPDVPFISGTVQGNKILIQARSPEDFQDLIIHEFTHYVLNKIGNRLPYWLNEGLATYEGIQMLEKERADRRIYSKIRAYLAFNEPPSLDRLQTKKYSKFVAMKGYEFSCSFVDYVIQEFGNDKMMEIVRKGTNWKKVLGVSKEELERGWHTYLKQEYRLD